MLQTFCLAAILVRRAYAGCSDRSPRDCSDTAVKPFNQDLPLCGNLDTTTRTAVHIFAVIGDYGMGNQCEFATRDLMDAVAKHHNSQYRGTDSRDVDFILTTGDNAYGDGTIEAIDNGVSAVWGRYINHSATAIWPPPPAAGSTVRNFSPNDPEALTHPEPRFFPSIGNHDQIYLGIDWSKTSTNYLPYVQYFNYLRTFPPYNGMWYSYCFSVHLSIFVLNSNEQIDVQSAWLQNALREDNATFKLVYFHHNPVGSSGSHAPSVYMRLPYSQWGATMVLSGHVHAYERFLVCDDGSAGPTCRAGHLMTQLVNGIGGADLDNLYPSQGCTMAPGSQFQFVDQFGFVIGVLSTPKGQEHIPNPIDTQIDYCLYSLKDKGSLNDAFTVRPYLPPTLSPSPAPSQAPTLPTTLSPTPPPTTGVPTPPPTTLAPSFSPTSPSPSLSPSLHPTFSPSVAHSPSPTSSPTSNSSSAVSPPAIPPSMSKGTIELISACSAVAALVIGGGCFWLFRRCSRKQAVVDDEGTKTEMDWRAGGGEELRRPNDRFDAPPPYSVLDRRINLEINA